MATIIVLNERHSLQLDEKLDYTIVYWQVYVICMQVFTYVVCTYTVILSSVDFLYSHTHDTYTLFYIIHTMHACVYTEMLFVVGSYCSITRCIKCSGVWLV